MSLKIGDNFSYLGKKFLDERQSFDTLELMYACDDVPEGFITYCKETEKRYEYKNGEWTVQIGELTALQENQLTNAYEHSQSTHAPVNAQANADITKEEIEAKLTGNVVTHTHDQYARITQLHEHSNKAILDTITQEMLDAMKSGADLDLTQYAKKTELHEHTNKAILDTITQDKIDTWESGANIDFSSFALKNELHTHSNKAVLDTITQEKIDGWENGANIDFSVFPLKSDIPTRISQLTNDRGYITDATLEEALQGIDLTDYARVEDLDLKFDDAQLNEEETTDSQIAIDFYGGGNKLTTLYFAAGSGGGTTTSAYISTVLSENVMVQTGESFNLMLDFSSPNVGRGTLKVFINDVDAMTTSINQGESTTVIGPDMLSKGTNKLVVYALDRVGTMSNSLTFYVRYGSTEIVSTFDPYISYDRGSVIRYYFTPTALDTSLSLTFYMKIDGILQTGVGCTSDVRGYYTFPSNLEVGAHECEAYVEDSAGNVSNILVFNLIILDDSALVVASDTKHPEIEEGEQLSLDYKVYMRNNTSFIVKVYVDGVLVNTGTCGLDTNYYKTSSLREGTRTVRIEVWDVTETVSDYVSWTVNVTPSTYEMKTPITAGSLFLASAVNKSNSDENRGNWIGVDEAGTQINAPLTNFAFNSESGWMNDSLIISGNSWVEVPIAPLSNNAKYGFTLDIEFSTKPIGVEDAEVLNLWDDENNCGIKITTEELIMQSKDGNRVDLYFSEEENVSAMFIIDRDEKMAKIYLNGVMCEAIALSDYTANGVTYLEDFTVNNNVFLGGYNKNGWCAIKNLRIYQVALATNEIINNFISNVINKSEQRALSEFQKGNDLPTVTVYCDFSGLGKDDKKPCNITYMSPDVNKYGESWSLTGKYSQLQYQGTSSMAYPIKNYRLNPRDSKGKKKIKMFSDGQPESRFTLKADFMSSGHWQNTGLAKFINDYLYHYDPKDEKSMNPMKWYSINHGGSMDDTRETINGFPCRLILVNDGETPLAEGQQEPTPGNTKDMGVFNFNNDKSNDKTFGFDTDIFPRCISYEVASNSDTSAGAFIPYETLPIIDIALIGENYATMYVPLNLFDPDNFVKTDGIITSAKRYLSGNYNNGYDIPIQPQDDGYIKLSHNNIGTHIRIEFSKDNPPTYIECIDGSKYTLNIISTEEYPNDVIKEPYRDMSGEIAYLKDSFELRYPDEDDVGADYGYLGMEADAPYVPTLYNYGNPSTTFMSLDYFGTHELTISTGNGNSFSYQTRDGEGTVLTTYSVTSGTTITLEDNITHMKLLGVVYDTLTINDIVYYVGENVTEDTKDPYIGKIFSSDYGLKRVVDWVGNADKEEFLANFEQYFNKQYTLRYYLIVILLAMVDNLGKNMMFDSWDGQIWYPRFYDMD